MAADDRKPFFRNSAYMTKEGIAAVNKAGKAHMAKLRAMRKARDARGTFAGNLPDDTEPSPKPPTESGHKK